MKSFLYILAIFLIPIGLISACKSTKKAAVKAKPNWVMNRPVDGSYYIGIGTASKTQNRLDYQQVAKKNALDDMISEIKVTVSSNSVLKSVQNNLDFNQQFNATTKVTALNTVENFDIVDSWENGTEFWIYYRLSKAEYEALKRRKMQVQIDRAEDFLSRADELDMRTNYVQILHMKIQALASLQNYLNEDVMGTYRGKDVKLVNEIFNSIQDQLYQVNYKSSVNLLQGTVGKPLPIFNTTALLKEGSHIANLPLKSGSDGASIESFDRIETDDNGIATFTKSRVQGVGSTQFLRVGIDLEKIITTDSLNPILRSIILSMQPPTTSIKVATNPLKIYIETEELNLSKTMSQSIIEPIVRKDLIQNGCTLENTKNEADYLIRIKANTQSQGAIWGEMQGAVVDVTFFLIDAKTNIELYRDGFQNIKGFQTTPENAGMDAYKKGVNEVNKKLLPSLKKALFSGGN